MKLHWAFILFAAASVSMQAGTLAQFRTIFGDIEVELLDQDKPATVQNFIRYVQSGRYRDVIIHRCNPLFVIQGGGYYVARRGASNEAIAAVQTYPAITNEFGVGARYSNLYGTIAMAKLGGNTNSATAQWFFNLADNTGLDAPNDDGFFTVFGRVMRGTNVLNMFKTFSYTNTTTNLIRNYGAVLGPPFAEFPLLTSALGYEDLIFVDISLLSVEVWAVAGGAREISWNSVEGRPNVIEFTVNFPPQWQTLTTTNGTGERIEVHDASADALQRFYRVRVDY